jgi:hypothetical protein
VFFLQLGLSFGIAGANMIEFLHIETERTQGGAAFLEWFLGAKRQLRLKRGVILRLNESRRQRE